MAGEDEADPLVASLVAAVEDYAIITLDPEGKILTWNAGAERINGYCAGEIVGLNVALLYAPDEVERDRPRIDLAEARDAGRLRCEGWRVRADGSRFWADVVITALHDRDHQLRGFGQILRDSTRSRMFQRELMRQALHDPLTGLPNRALLMDRLGKALARLQRLGGTVAVFFLDLDRFKDINDSLGHQQGDQLLVTVADRLRSAVRTQDTVARLSGDEFVVVCEGLHDDLTVPMIARRLTAALGEPVLLGGTTVPPAASIGVAVTNEAQDEPEALLRDADAAMYRAKRALQREQIHVEFSHRQERQRPGGRPQ